MSGVEIKPAASEAEVEAIRSDPSFTEYGGGFVDYTDNDFAAGTRSILPVNTPWQLTRDLTATGANVRLNRPFAGHQFWDNTAKVIRGRALYDLVMMSMAIRVIPDQLGGVLRVAIVAGAIEIGGKNMAITAPVGSMESIRADFIFPVRNALFTNGGKIMLTSNVPMALIETSPEFYAIGYEAS
jgi:hypothetical protein